LFYREPLASRTLEFPLKSDLENRGQIVSVGGVFGRIGANAFQAAAKEVAAVGGKSFQPHLEKRREILTNLSGKGGKIYQICLEKAANFNKSARKRWNNLPNLSGKGGKSFQPHLEKGRKF
jgi:hypothetical protein